MSAWESLRMAFAALIANKGRSSLTVLGVVIGITAVIALVAVGQGAQAEVTSSIEGLGSNLLYVRYDSGVAGADKISEADVAAVSDVTGVQAVAPEAYAAGSVTYQGESASPTISGTTPAWSEVRNTSVQEGRFLTNDDLARASRVAVVGTDVEADLGVDSLLGEKITVNGIPFTVVGVLETKGGFGSFSPDDIVLVPATTALSRLIGSDGYGAISIQVADAALMEQVETGVAEVLRERHRIAEGAEDDFAVTNQADILATVNDITGILTALLGSIAGISLLVGGIGIMNIMLVSVTERTRDIGIRKAIGARRSDIMGQFLIESLVLSIFGGLLGVLGGFLLSRVLGGFLGFEAVITPQSVALAVGVSAAIGIFFGVYPAWKASRQDPIEALRYE